MGIVNLGAGSFGAATFLLPRQIAFQLSRRLLAKNQSGRAGECFPILMPKHPHPGMRFYFLPPYSPELNRIELLWHKMKYEWLPFKTFTPDELEQAIDEIGLGFGSQYTLTFC